MWVIGIDPGSSSSDGDGGGGWCLLRQGRPGQAIEVAGRGRLGGCGDGWRGLAVPWEAMTAAIEDVGPRPGEGVRSVWSFARGLGQAEGALAALGVRRVERVPASQWKPAMGLPGGKAGKAQAVALARRLGLPAGCSEHEAEAYLIGRFVALRRLGWDVP